MDLSLAVTISTFLTVFSLAGFIIASSLIVVYLLTGLTVSITYIPVYIICGSITAYLIDRYMRLSKQMEEEYKDIFR